VNGTLHDERYSSDDDARGIEIEANSDSGDIRVDAPLA